MRQWYKLQQSYEMMRAFEQKQGWHFDLVMKMRTVSPTPVNLKA